MRRWLTARRADRPLPCHKVAKLLQTYLDGAVDDLTARRVVRHLEDCRRCGLEADTYLAIKASLARRDAQLPAEALDRLRDFTRHLASGHHTGDDLTGGEDHRDGDPPGGAGEAPGA